MRIKPNSSGTSQSRQVTVLQSLNVRARNKPLQQGFTLLEIMVVMIIMAIVAAIGIPAFSSWREKQAVHNAAQSLLAHLKQARVLAVSENRSVSFTFTSTSYTFDAGVCASCKNYTVNLSQFSNNMLITRNDPSLVPTKKTFSSRGTSSTTPLYLCSSGYSKRIIMNIIGRARECLPGDKSLACIRAYNCK